MKLWNIGAEGQFIMGAFGASAIVLAPILPAETLALDVHPCDGDGGHGGGRGLGFYPRLF